MTLICWHRGWGEGQASLYCDSAHACLIYAPGADYPTLLEKIAYDH